MWREQGALIPNPNLFFVSDELGGGSDLNQFGFIIYYKL